MSGERQSEREVKEETLSDIRDVYASLQRVPAAGISSDQFSQLQEATENLGSIERPLTNEVDQLSSDGPQVEQSKAWALSAKKERSG